MKVGYARMSCAGRASPTTTRTCPSTIFWTRGWFPFGCCVAWDGGEDRVGGQERSKARQCDAPRGRMRWQGICHGTSFLRAGPLCPHHPAQPTTTPLLVVFFSHAHTGSTWLYGIIIGIVIMLGTGTLLHSKDLCILVFDPQWELFWPNGRRARSGLTNTVRERTAFDEHSPYAKGAQHRFLRAS